MINKELLSEVLGINIFDILNEHDNYLVFGSNSKTKYSIRGEAYCHINIYELAHKCKEWASKNSYELESSVNMQPKQMRVAGCQIHCRFENEDLPYFVAKTEPEVIFKACQWILDNKGTE